MSDFAVWSLLVLISKAFFGSTDGFIAQIDPSDAPDVVVITMKTKDNHVKIDISSNETVIDYLSTFGYLKGVEANNYNITSEIYMKAIRMFQVFNEIDADTLGEMDEKTVEKMNLPRWICHAQDIIEKWGIFPRRKKRFVIQGSKWKNGNITYKISQYPKPSSTTMSKAEVNEEIKKAFDLWKKHANLNFIQRRKGRVKINIRFESGKHGDGVEFDGPGGTLGHGFFPIFGGDVHLDNAEQWVRNGVEGKDRRRTSIDLMSTAAHEIGHALGLSHSNVARAIMAPFYKKYDPNLQLDQDDIKAIQKLYGPRDRNRVEEVEEIPVEKTSMCKDLRIDTMVTHNGSNYLFSGNLYWKIGNKTTKVEDGYPRNITDDWKGLPANLDASFAYTNGKTYFLQGKHVYRYSNGKVDKGFPKNISKALHGLPDNIDAAFFWSETQMLYIFKACEYWIYNPKGKKGEKNSGPHSISDIPGFPGYLDAAQYFTNGRVYVFSDGWYYRLSKDDLIIDQDEKRPFPRLTTNRWFGCPRHKPSTKPLSNYCELQPLSQLDEIKILGFG